MTKRLLKALATVCAVVLLIGALPASALTTINDASLTSSGVVIGLHGYYYTDTAETLLSYINEIRYEACQIGAPDPRNPERSLTLSDYRPVKWSRDLEAIARIRAAETCVFESHTRPDETPFYSINLNGMCAESELLALCLTQYTGSTSLLAAFAIWYSEQEAWLKRNATQENGHYAEMINPANTYFGMGSFWALNGNWIAIAGEFSKTSAACNQTKDSFEGECLRGIGISPKYITKFDFPDRTIYYGQSSGIRVNVTIRIPADYSYFGQREITGQIISGLIMSTQYGYEDVVSLRSGRIYGEHIGDTVVNAAVQGTSRGTTCYVKVRYPDVPDSAWFFEATKYVSNKGYVTGYASGKFGAGDNLQRQDFVSILARIAGADLTPYQNETGGLKDVKAGSYYAPAVAWAVENGIVAGYQNGKFGVGDPITREQVCTILWRFMGSPAANEDVLARFPDQDRISDFAKTAVAWAVENGVISGMQNGTVSPVTGASRAQIAVIVMNMDKKGMFDIQTAEPV
ncbi:MAG: S-layer homology domain-containing protein [Clostridia bacterium]|nr:S-layer homology domain-containing protein [Clostridia bacterium]